jgi:hypothetical protein
VSAKALPRALEIMEAIKAEATRRGYEFVAKADDRCRFRIVTGEDGFEFTMPEEQDKSEVYSEEEIAAAKYPWQRVSARSALVPSSRLAIEMVDGYGTRRWVDRSRWTLTDKLPDLFAVVEDRAKEARTKRVAAAQAAARIREEWEQAVPKARERYLAELNRRRALDQAAAWRAAGDLHAYAAALRQAADAREGEHRQSILEWAAFAQQHADQIGPVKQDEELHFAEPEQLSSDDLDRHMPAAWSAPIGRISGTGLRR